MSTATRFSGNRVLVGFTEDQSHHYGTDGYRGAIPIDDVANGLFGWEPVLGAVSTDLITMDGVTRITDPSRVAVVRPDTQKILGVFRDGYRPHSYKEWLVTNVANLLQDGDLEIGGAGLIKGGAVAWVQVRAPETAFVAGVEYASHVTAITSLDGSLATTYQTGNIALICQNQLGLALRTAVERVKIKHTRNSIGRVEDVQMALGLVTATRDAFAEEVERLTAEHVSPRQWEKFLDKYVPIAEDAKARARTMGERKRDELEMLYTHDERVAPWSGTAYGVLTAVNTWAHHIQGVRGETREDRNALRTVTGEWEKVDTRTLEVLASVM